MGNACFGPNSHQTDIEDNAPKDAKKTLSNDTKQLPRVSAKQVTVKPLKGNIDNEEVVAPQHRRNSILTIKYEQSEDS